MEQWNGFKGKTWKEEVNVRDFIQENYTPYDGTDEFLAGPTEATTKLWDQVMDLNKQERDAGGVLDMDTKIVSTITSHGPGMKLILKFLTSSVTTVKHTTKVYLMRTLLKSELHAVLVLSLDFLMLMVVGVSSVTTVA